MRAAAAAFYCVALAVAALVGLRAGLLDTRLRQLAVSVGAGHAVDLEFSAEYLARDGYHPSGLGYRVWAQGLAVSLAPVARCAP